MAVTTVMEAGMGQHGRYEVYLIGGADNETAVFTLFADGGDCRIRCGYRHKLIESTATDFFEALCNIRRQLAAEGLLPFCYGASLNVYPSGMSRDMGQGLNAYRLVMGQQAAMTDLVDIFGTGPDVIPASVELQETFFRDWIEKLGE